MTQYGLKAGLRKFGERAGNAAVKELTTLHVMDTWKLTHAHKLVDEGSAGESSLVSHLHQREMGRHDERERLCQWGSSAKNHPEGERCLTYCGNIERVSDKLDCCI